LEGLQSVYKQFKSLPAPTAAILNAEGAAIANTPKENIHMNTLKIINLQEADRESIPETLTTTATKTATKTGKTGSAVTAIPQATCKMTAGKERQPKWTETVNLSGDRTKQVEKYNPKKKAGSWGTSDNSSGAVVTLSRIRII